MGAIRLFLALVVALAHSPLGVPGWPVLGINAGVAVILFYVISGFLMSTVLAEKYEASRAGTWRFYGARARRIFGLYWPMLLLCFMARPETLNFFWAATAVQKFTNVFLFGADWYLILNDPANEMTWKALPEPMQQAWTLAAELFFYIVAPWVLRSRALSIGLLIGSFATLAGIRLFTVPATAINWTYFFPPATIGFFLLGHEARLLAQRYPLLVDRYIGAAIFCAMILCFAAPVGWASPRFAIGKLCFAAALPWLFRFTSKNRLLNWLGNLSFPVYLVHTLVLMQFEQRLGLPHPAIFDSGAALIVSYTLCVVLAAIVVFHGIEVTVTRGINAVVTKLAAPRLLASVPGNSQPT
jgi:peptidoglycan/LPS O-acetylase OafA/YrhL